MIREQSSTTTAAVSQPDETEVIDSAETQGAALAWSQAETDEVVPYVHTSSRSRWALLAIALVVVLGALGALWFTTTHNKGPATPSNRVATPNKAPDAVATPRGPIDGSYRVDHYRGQAVIRTPSGAVSSVGAAYSTVDTEWWAFRSQCAPACTAVGTRLDDDTHLRAAIAHTPDLPAGEATQTLRLIDGQWQTDRPNKVRQDCVGVPGGDSWRWSLELTQLPDNSLKGQETDVVESNECSSIGNVITTPVVATRVGDIPPNLPPTTK